jgi:two-component system, LytTR family, sensor kinase
MPSELKAVWTTGSTRPSIFDTRTGRWLAVVTFWTVVAVVVATLSHTRMLAVNRPSVYSNWLLDCLLVWWGWAAWTPLIMWLGRRFYIDGRNRFKHGAILLLLGIVLVNIQASYQIFVSLTVMGESLSTYRNTLIAELAWMGPWDLLIYFGVVGVGYARDYRARWRERELAAHQLEIQLAHAQLDVLKSQLQPHFFFNTLNSISVLIRKNQPEQAQEMLGRLSDLLRYTLSIGARQTVPLREELQFVSGYLEIEQIRFGDRLSINIEVDPSCETLPIPPLVIQPLAENAIRHGLAEKNGKGRLDISIARHDGLLSIVVEDDGVGYRPDVGGVPREGLGLGNTRSRLERLYGDRFLFSINPRDSGGTCVRLDIPCEQPHERKP